MNPDRAASRLAVWLLVVGVLIGAVAALWIASELHYRNCLTESEQLARSTPRTVKVFGAVYGKSCSRLP